MNNLAGLTTRADSVSNPSLASDAGLVVGLDGGGSSCDAVAVDPNGTIVFEGTSGPVNATTASPDLVDKHLAAATLGCPDRPVMVGACFAGTSDRATATRIYSRLRVRFPESPIRLAPDYVAAVLANPDADICVIAGTGSAIASLISREIRVTGGLGPLIGDYGSGFRYGQQLLEHALGVPPDEVGAEITAAIRSAIGAEGRDRIVSAVYGSSAPAALVARLAPILTGLAEHGEPWAVETVERETRLLARSLGYHARRYQPGRVGQPLTISLAGGVWQSHLTIETFVRALHELAGLESAQVHPHQVQPVLGALRLALLPDEAADPLTCHHPRP